MKPSIRTITGFISVKDFFKFKELLEELIFLKNKYENCGYEVQTVRITTDIIEQAESMNFLEKHSEFLGLLENNRDVSIYHLGSVNKKDWLSFNSERKLIDFFLKYKKAFLTIDAGSEKDGYDLCLQGARMCKLIAKKNSFECRRFAVYAGLSESTPFYPASRVFSNSMKFAIGLQCANLAVEEAKKNKKNKKAFEADLRKRLETEFGELEKIMPEKIKNNFIGFDTSLAPFPQNEISIAEAIEIILGKPFGSSGTLSACRLLTKIMKENSIKKTGLCGLMLPVVEDNVLAKRGIEKRYTLRDLLLFSSVCATGLDTIPISGKTSINDLADCYYDLSTLANKLQKPLSARFFLEPKKLAGETVKYDWKFACESPVFEI